MFESVSENFVGSGLLDEPEFTTAQSIAESFVTTKDIVNHRSRKYILGGAILFFCHNRTENVYRPSTIASQLGDDFSPSKLTVSAHRIGQQEAEEYRKPTSKCFAYKFADELDCSDEVKYLIDELYDDVGELPGKSNSGSGAAILYIAALLANDKRTQAEISEVSGRSEVGIRNLYYEILEKSSLDLESFDAKSLA